MTNKIRSAIGGLALMASAAFGGTNDVALAQSDSNAVSSSTIESTVLDDYQTIAPLAPAFTNALVFFSPEYTPSGVVVRATGFTPGVAYKFETKESLSDPLWERVGAYITQHTNESQVVEKLIPTKAKAFYRGSTK